MRPPRHWRAWIGPLILVGLVVLVVAACATGQPGGSPGASGSAAITPTPPAAIALEPAKPDNPFNLLAWIFTPLFQAFFILLVLLDYSTAISKLVDQNVTLAQRLAILEEKLRERDRS